MVFHFAAATMVGRPQGRHWVHGGRICAAAFLALTAMVASSPSTAQTPPQFTVAFIGDQGLTAAARNVLHLIVAEGADAVLHSGDFDYTDDPPAWNAQIDSILGVDFPYFASIGNHDEVHYYGPGGYQEYIAARMNRLGIPWSGDLGVQCNFVYQGIDFVLTAPGIAGSGHDTYIRDHFATSASRWRVSSHHKVMHLMQPEGKDDDTGWGVYEEARQAGAIIATAHAHAYSRTHLLDHMQTLSIASTEALLAVSGDDVMTPADEGATFAFVSGLGGKSTRPQEASGAWFASIYTETQDAEYGALFGVFNLAGIPDLAHFYFKTISGQIIDEFYVRTRVVPAVTGIGADDAGALALRLASSGERRRVVVLYRLPAPMPVSLDVFDVRGRLVVTAFRNAPHAAGDHRWQWDGKTPGAGVYFVQLRTPRDGRAVRAVLRP